jgi:hypothetical protein
MANKYDETEARELLARKSEQLTPDLKGHIEASEQLLAELLKLETPSSVGFEKNTAGGGGVWLSLSSGANALLRLRPQNGELFISKDAAAVEKKLMKVSRLAFNPTRRIWEGTEDDQRPVPIGTTRSKRSALAVVLDQMISFAEAHVNEDQEID